MPRVFESSESPRSWSFEVLISSSSTSITTSAFALSACSMMRSATLTFSTLSIITIAFSRSFAAMNRVASRLRRMVNTSFTSAFERKKVWMIRSSYAWRFAGVFCRIMIVCSSSTL